MNMQYIIAGNFSWGRFACSLAPLGRSSFQNRATYTLAEYIVSINHRAATALAEELYATDWVLPEAPFTVPEALFGGVVL